MYNIRINRKKIALQLCIIALISLGELADIYEYIMPRYVVYIIIAFVILISILHLKIRNTNKITKHGVFVFFLGSMLAFIILGMLTLNNILRVEIGCFIACFIFIIAMTDNKYIDWIDYIYTPMILFSVFYGIMTYVCWLNEGFYLSKIAPIFGTYESFLIECYKQGYIAGMTAHYTRNGIYTAFGLITFASLLFAQNYKRRYMQVIFIIMMIGALLLTGKRAHLLFVICALLFSYYIYFSNRPKTRMMNFILVGVILLFGINILINFVPAFGNVFDRFDNLLTDENVETRFRLWSLAWDQFKENPIFGIGWRHFMQTTVSGFGADLNVHNMYIQLFCETGLVGAVVFIAFFIGVYIMSIITFYDQRRRQDVYRKNAGRDLFFSVTVQTFFLLYCFSGSPFDDIHFYIIYLLAVGVGFLYYSTYYKRDI